MSAEPITPETGRRSVVGTALRWLGVLAAAGFVGLLVYGVMAQAPDRRIDDALARAEAVDAPGFELEVLERGRVPAPLTSVVDRAARDGRIALSELRGTPVVLNFWASWCDPCRDESPYLERLWREKRSQGLVLVGVNEEDVSKDARRFARRYGLSYPLVRDKSGGLRDDYRLRGYPETFVVDRQGKVVERVAGPVHRGKGRERFERALARALRA